MTGLALLGAGRIARLHAMAARAAGARIVAVFDVVADAAKALAKETGAAVAASAEEAVGHGEVEGVIVASSTDAHVAQVLLAVGADRPVLCEKPLAPTLEEAARCLDTLGGKASQVQIGFNRRFDPSHAALAAALAAGEIGAVEQLVITSRDPAPPPADYIRRSGGLFRDMTIHDFDTARWLLGEEPETVFAQGACLVDAGIGALGDIDTAAVMMTTGSGKECVILNSRRAAHGYDQRIEAFGPGGMLISDNHPRTSLRRSGQGQYGAADRLFEFFLDRYAESYRLEVGAFLAAIRGQGTIAVTAVDGYRALLLAEAAATSLRTGQPAGVAKP
jgi:myo-inositol 2-dehydrogenase/D-chiro-inositol 1-dehydrogenase